MNNRLRLLDYVFLTRPILFFPGWATLLIGYAAAVGEHQYLSSINHGSYFPAFFNTSLILSLLAFTLAMGGCFVLNQVYDISSDKVNKKLFLLGDGFISVKNGYRESIFLIVLSFLPAAFLNPELLLAIFLFNLITGYFYNIRPFAVKNTPLWGLAANMAMGWLAFVIGWLTRAELSSSLFIASLPFLFFNTALYFLTTLPDFDGDAKTGKVTFPVKYGMVKTINLCLFFFILAFIISIWHKNEYMLVVSVLTAPFMIRLYFYKTVQAAIVAVKAGISFFALVVCLKFPLFLVLMALTFFLTRFYYKNRFGYDYPNFKGH